MYFIAESGSTKCDWMLVDGKNNQSFCSTMGFNPYFHSSDLIETELKKSIHYYRLIEDLESKSTILQDDIFEQAKQMETNNTRYSCGLAISKLLYRQAIQESEKNKV